ncbi:MAG: response regulator [Lachnospiraceae bacterium]|nr:response regulator [Lachnospiraceae bacterium]
MAQFSHEIRTPLNAVRGYLWLLQETSLSKEQENQVEEMELASGKLLQVINHILDYSKIEAGKMLLKKEDFSLRMVVDEVEHMLFNEASMKNIRLKMKVEKEVPDFLQGDEIRLHQLLQNLIYNGIKFTKEGEVSLLVQRKESQKDCCTLGFYIRDTGIGIPKDRLEKGFEPYSRNYRAGTDGTEGTGLGLAISREIIRLASDNRYDLRVESQVGKGSCFSFSMDFPVISKEAPVAFLEAKKKRKKQAAPGKRPILKQEKILLVEDNPVNLKLEKRILNQLGYEADVTDQPEQVEDMVLQKDYDLILLDIGMPRLNGYELARRLKEQEKNRHIPVIALSAYRKQDVKSHISNGEIDDYLPKPVEPEQLKEKIALYLGEEKESSEYVDFSKLIDFLNGDRDAVRELITIFLEDKKDEDKRIEQYLKERKQKEAHDRIHSLKGVSASMYCYPLRDSCKKLMDLLETGEVPKEEIEVWKEVFRMTYDVLEKYKRIK